MGGIPLKQNSTYVSKYGNIYLEPDADSYYPGDSVTGNIYLNLHTRFPGKTIQLRIKGKEMIWSQPTTDSTEYIQEKNIVFDKKFTFDLEKPGDVLEAGQYQIPFCFLLPEGIPGTCNYIETRLGASIMYTLSASLLPKDSTTSIEFNYKRPLLVHETPVRVEDIPEQFPIPVKSCWGCMNNGFSLISVSLNKLAFLPSNEILITLSIDNTKCSKPVHDLTLELRQRITLKGKKVSHSRNYVIAQKSTNTGELAGESPELATISFLLPKVTPVDPYESMHFDKARDKALTNSDELGCTSKGLLIQSEFFVEVTANVEGTCVSNTPKYIFPLQILHPSYNFPKLDPPKNWKPAIQPVANLAIALSPEYADLSTSKRVAMSSSWGSSPTKMSGTSQKKIDLDTSRENFSGNYILYNESK